MSDSVSIGFPEAARYIGVPLRVLRHAIRAGRLPAPPHGGATASLSAEWLNSVRTAIEASPKALSRAASQKVAPFARYDGTSAWRKYTRRVRAYARFQAGSKPTSPG